METPRLLSSSLSSTTTTAAAALKPSETILTLSLLPSTSRRNPNSFNFIYCRYTKKPPPGSNSSNTSTSKTNSSSWYWNSNADDTFRSSRFRFEEEDDDDEEEDYDDSGSRFRWRDTQKRKWWSDGDGDDNVVEQVIENVWFFKVFRSFGWLLPAIVISMLVTTGPKAFLMAIALPLGQSAVSFAIDKVFGRTRDSPKRRPRTKKRPFNRAPSVEIDDEELDESSDVSEKKQGYQSWVASDNGSVKQKMGVDQRKPSFGGWDELDRQQRPDKRTTRTRRPPTSGARGEGLEKGKMSRRGRRRDTPLLLRLLISVFPFLGSWTRLL